MKVEIKGLINLLDSLRERLNDLFDHLDYLDDMEEEEIETMELEQFFSPDDAFNLSIVVGVLEQVEKLDKALEIIKEYFVLTSEYGKVSLEPKKSIPENKLNELKEVLL